MFFGAPPVSACWTGGNAAGCGDGPPVVWVSVRVAESDSAIVTLSLVSPLAQYFGHAAGVIAFVNSGAALKFVMPLDIAVERIARMLVEQDHVTR